MASEKIINVPLESAVRKRLNEQAKANGRAVRREAAAIIKDGLKPSAKKGGGQLPFAYGKTMMRRRAKGGTRNDGKA